MLRVSAIEAAKLVVAASFVLKDDVKFEGFDDVGETELSHTVNVRKNGEMSEYEQEFNQLDIWADLSLGFTGEPPNSYRVFNSMIVDWVDEHEDELKKIINPKLIPFLKEKFPDLDVSDLKEDFDDYIFEDQVDYVAGIDEEDGRLHFCIEMVLDIENEDDDKNFDKKEES
jgi:hypothetical protein